MYSNGKLWSRLAVSIRSYYIKLLLNLKHPILTACNGSVKHAYSTRQTNNVNKTNRTLDSVTSTRCSKLVFPDDPCSIPFTCSHLSSIPITLRPHFLIQPPIWINYAQINYIQPTYCSLTAWATTSYCYFGIHMKLSINKYSLCALHSSNR